MESRTFPCGWLPHAAHRSLLSTSRKERIKTWDDVRHTFNDLLKNRVDWRQWHRSILERYKDHNLTIHLHGTGRLRGDRWPGSITCRQTEDVSRDESLAARAAARHLNNFQHRAARLANA